MVYLRIPSSPSFALPSRTKSCTVRTLSKTVSSRLSPRPSVSPILADSRRCIAEIHSKSFNFVLSGALALGLFLGGIEFAEAKVGVNKPELLPKEFSTIIDVAGFLSDGQEKRLAQEIASLEKDTGFKLRVLAQNYPETPGITWSSQSSPYRTWNKLKFTPPLQIYDYLIAEPSLIVKSPMHSTGLAIKDFWQVDDRTIVFVADPTFGNILNFNVGATVDLDIPRSFWSRLAGKYGNIFYWKEQGEDASIEAAVAAISNCLREPVGPNNCSEVK